MPREGYTGLSIKAEEYDKLYRDFTKLKKDITFTKWHTKIVHSAIVKSEIINKTFPNWVGTIIDNAMIIEDTKSGKIVKVELKDNKIVCKDENHDFVTFACLHPEFLSQ